MSKNKIIEEPEEKQPTKPIKAKRKTANKTKTTSSKKNISVIDFIKDKRSHYISGVLLIIFSTFLLIAFTSYFFTWWHDNDKISNLSFFSLLFDDKIIVENSAGKIGAYISYVFINKWFGIASYLLILTFVVSGFRLLKLRILPIVRTWVYSLLGIIWLSSFIGTFLNTGRGTTYCGIFGYESALWLSSILGKPISIIILIILPIAFIMIAFNLTFKWRKKNAIIEIEEPILPSIPEDDIIENEVVVEDEKNNIVPEIVKKNIPIENTTEVELPIGETVSKKSKDIPIELTIEKPEESEIEEDDVDNNNIKVPHYTIDTPFDPTLDLPSYKFPTVELLEDYGNEEIEIQNDELIANKNRIVETLRNYSIEIAQIKATIGPTVTLYEIVPAPGVRISRIKNLEDDIALSLSALGIRIIAPIPGKGTIGIEVPNLKPKIVSMRTVISSDKFLSAKFDLPIALGKTISNETYVFDLAKMPHLLMAGATGQGKSVGLNAIITSLLYKKHPSQLKFVLVDPKKVELTLFSKIERHYLAKLPDTEEAIITDTRKVVRTLNSLTIEMDTRYDLLKDAQVRNIKEYNAKFISRKLNPNNGHRFLPYIVLIVDEFADLIMTAGREVENPIARLAQLARAIGIHLVIATQRPSVNIITGTIKANFPARIAFRVTSKIDSRTILDCSGADQLIGRGDMLLSTGNDLTRLQCAFIDTPEVDEITAFVGNQRGYPSAFLLPECVDEESEKVKDLDPNDKDEFFDDAARLIVQNQHGSTSLIQRKLKLGYNRAGRIIDQLEAAGIVGPFEGSKARVVNYKDLSALEQFLRDYNS